jgi:hypothetical protein
MDEPEENDSSKAIPATEPRARPVTKSGFQSSHLGGIRLDDSIVLNMEL